jgi:secondary thiamine-phosphate synthase enzyme
MKIRILQSRLGLFSRFDLYMLYEFEIQTSRKNELLEVDHLLAEALHRSGLQDGALLVFSPHTTAGMTINENADPAVKQDILATLEKNIPDLPEYLHQEGNSAAHLKTSIMGSSVYVPVTGNKLKLGTWRRLWVIPLASAAEH